MQRRYNYNVGRQDILLKGGNRKDGKQYNRVVMNWIDAILSRHVGFVTGRPINVSVPDDAPDEAIQALEEYDVIRNDNDLDAMDSELFHDALLYGYGVEVHSYDGERIVIESYDPREWLFLLDADEVEIAAIRRLQLNAGTVYEDAVLADDVVLWWLYSDTEIVEYKESIPNPALRTSTPGGVPVVGQPAMETTGLEETGRTRHEYGTLPVFRWTVDPEYAAFVTDSMMGLQDAYNNAISNHLDDLDTDIDALLAISGAAPGELTRVNPVSGQTQMAELRELGAIVFPDHETSAEFLVRNLSTEKIDYTVRLLRRLIFSSAALPDLDEMVGATGQTSGIALQLQFQGQIERAAAWSKYIAQSFEDRIERLNRIWQAKNMPVLEDYTVRLSYEIPVNEIEIWQNIEALEPLLSRRDRAKLVPSIEDPEAAIAAKEAETADAAIGPNVAPGAVQANAGTLAQTGTGEGVIDAATAQMQDALAATLAGQGVTVSAADMAAVIDEFMRTLR